MLVNVKINNVSVVGMLESRKNPRVFLHGEAPPLQQRVAPETEKIPFELGKVPARNQFFVAIFSVWRRHHDGDVAVFNRLLEQLQFLCDVTDVVFDGAVEEDLIVLSP